MKKLSRVLTPALGLALLAGAAALSAQTPKPPDQKSAAMTEQAMPEQRADNMHSMPATVDKVDLKTGMVDVTSEGMKLKLHYPPATLATLKPGDRITLHLGYSKQY